MNFAETLALVWRKDMRIELRSKDTLVTLVFFALVMTMVFTFGFANDPQTNLRVFPSVLWANILFCGTLGVGRTFAREARDGAFTALVLSPAHRGAILAAKTLVNLFLTLVVTALTTPILAVMLRVDLSAVAGLISAQLFLGAAGFALVGTPLAVMAVNARFAEVLLPMVVFPLVAPVLIAGVTGTASILGTIPEDDPRPWFQLMIGFDLVYLVGGQFLFDRMVTE
jgi:heme exporter protein B